MIKSKGLIMLRVAPWFDRKRVSMLTLLSKAPASISHATVWCSSDRLLIDKSTNVMDLFSPSAWASQRQPATLSDPRSFRVRISVFTVALLWMALRKAISASA